MSCWGGEVWFALATGMAALARTPIFPEATPLGPLSALLAWINAISLPDLFRPNARYLPAPRRVEDRCARRGELKGIPIAARDQCRAAGTLLKGDSRGEKIVRFVSVSFGVRKPKCDDKFRQDI